MQDDRTVSEINEGGARNPKSDPGVGLANLSLGVLAPLTRAREGLCGIGALAIRSYERFLELPVAMVLSVVWLAGCTLPGLALVGLWVLLAHVAR
jgi:hypothetical protein